MCNKRSTILPDHNYNLLNNHKIAKKKYLSNWEKNLKLNIKHVFDDFSAKYEKLICWLDFKGDSMGRHFVKKFGNRINSNVHLSLVYYSNIDLYFTLEKIYEHHFCL